VYAAAITLERMPHVEERRLSIELNLVAEFDESYEGDEDGFVWFDRFESELKPQLVSAVTETLRKDPRFSLRIAPRGKDPERALELELRFNPR
jgi:hypothetical protein